jgi:hypothetical protein
MLRSFSSAVVLVQAYRTRYNRAANTDDSHPVTGEN